ncbi:hypothetical protein ACS0TY_018779 [Phlomoides rotata]
MRSSEAVHLIPLASCEIKVRNPPIIGEIIETLEQIEWRPNSLGWEFREHERMREHLAEGGCDRCQILERPHITHGKSRRVVFSYYNIRAGETSHNTWQKQKKNFRIEFLSPVSQRLGGLTFYLGFLSSYTSKFLTCPLYYSSQVQVGFNLSRNGKEIVVVNTCFPSFIKPMIRSNIAGSFWLLKAVILIQNVEVRRCVLESSGIVVTCREELSHGLCPVVLASLSGGSKTCIFSKDIPMWSSAWRTVGCLQTASLGRSMIQIQMNLLAIWVHDLLYTDPSSEYPVHQN